MRHGTSIVIAVLLAAVLVAGVVQIFFLAR
jgi:Tfp pilus assembly protein PilW